MTAGDEATYDDLPTHPDAADATGATDETAAAGRPTTDVEELRRRVDALEWFHYIDLGHGVVTKGQRNPRETVPDRWFPDVAGKSCLDIGAWDGYTSFEAERRGASRVVAVDHYVWGVDRWARDAYWLQCDNAGVLPDHGRDMTDFWRADLPGKRPFDLAHEILDSKVEAVVADFTTIDLDELGSFDVAFYVGVLYHMRDPLTALERLRKVTREVAVIETEAMEVRGMEQQPLATFVQGGEIGGEHGNWWIPNMTALRGMVRAAGFSRIEVCQAAPADLFGPPRPAGSERLGAALRRALTEPSSGGAAADALDALRLRVGAPPPQPPAVAHYRAMVLAFP